MAVTFCANDKCEKANQCTRFLTKGDTEIFFKNICFKENNFRHFQQAEQNVVIKQ